MFRRAASNQSAVHICISLSIQPRVRTRPGPHSRMAARPPCPLLKHFSRRVSDSSAISSGYCGRSFTLRRCKWFAIPAGTSCILRAMSVQIRGRGAALLEVFGVYLTGAFLSDQVAQLLVRWGVISPQNPLKLLTVHTTNGELLVASRQLLLILTITYGSYFALIIPINW